MSMFGWGVGDIATISTLVVKVYTAYKDAPDNYRHISEEVESLQILINKAIRHIESPALSEDDRQEGRKVLKGCQSILEDLDSLIEKYNSLASASSGQALKKVQLGTEDIATLRSRLISNTVLLNGFIQSCEIQAQLSKVLGLHRTNSRVSVNSITSFAGSINTKKAYKKFCKGLFQIGVTPEMISQHETAIHNIFKPKNTAASSQINSNSDTTADQSQDQPEDQLESQLPVVGGEATSPSMPTGRNIPTEYKKSRFPWARPPVDFLVGPQMLAAAEAGNTKRLISALNYIRNIDFADDEKETALHKAASRGHTDMVELLLRKGASIEAMDIGDNNSLHLAAAHNHPSTVELLLQQGASIEARNDNNNTSLHVAAGYGHLEIVELLLRKGALIEAMGVNNNTPLNIAAFYGRTSVVELLLGSGASTETTNENGNTPLHRAAMGGHTDVVKLLLEEGTSIKSRNGKNITPLHFAARNGHTSTVKLLLERGAPTDTMDMNGTPLHLATRKGHTSMHGTPLHLAAREGHTSIVELLLKTGASIEVKDEHNKTPLDWAKENGHTDIVGFLESAAE